MVPHARAAVQSSRIRKIFDRMQQIKYLAICEQATVVLGYISSFKLVKVHEGSTWLRISLYVRTCMFISLILLFGNGAVKLYVIIDMYVYKLN